MCNINKIIKNGNEYNFQKDKIEFKDKLSTRTQKNISSYLINDILVVVSKDLIYFDCEKCGKEIESMWSNYKTRKHFLCISCTRKETVSEVIKTMTKERREEINKKISKRTKEAMSNFSLEKKKKMYVKMSQSLDLKKHVCKMHEKNRKKSIEEKKEIYEKISKSMKNHYQEKGPWNLKKNKISIKNRSIPENKWFIRGEQSSNEILSTICNDCKSEYKARRVVLAKQEELHPGYIYCLKCKSNGNRNGSYIDGRKFNGDNTYTPLFLNNNYRNQIIKEQEYICPICGNNLDSSPHLHHIDYNKKNDNKNNLVFLHNSCHMKTNYDRDFWKIFFNNYYKNYYEELYISEEYVEKYFRLFPLINHNFSEEFLRKKICNRKKFDSNNPPNTKGHNISKMMSKKYFYSRKRKNNSSIVDILSSKKILEIYKNGDSLSKIINKITSRLYSYPVSLFSHHIMDWILLKYSKAGDIVYDPAGGFGGRLLGTYYHNIKYITTDPFTYDDLDYMNNFFNLNAIIYNKKSEELKISCDLVVCCPPYYNDENYENIENRNYDVWLKEYWEETINNVESNKFVLIIGEKYQEMINIVLKKWKEIERYEIVNKSFNSINKEFIIYCTKI